MKLQSPGSHTLTFDTPSLLYTFTTTQEGIVIHTIHVIFLEYHVNLSNKFYLL